MGASLLFLYVHINTVIVVSHRYHLGPDFEPQLFMSQLLLFEDRIVHILFCSLFSFESNQSSFESV